jgi:hypothetical protein
MKKYIILLLALSVVLAFAGCGEDEIAPEIPDNRPTQDSFLEPPDEDENAGDGIPDVPYDETPYDEDGQTEPPAPAEDPDPCENGHTEGEAATCVTAQLCTLCGEELTPALGEHIWSEWSVTTPAAVDIAGEEARICEVCQDSETREIPALPAPTPTPPPAPATPKSGDRKTEDGQEYVYDDYYGWWPVFPEINNIVEVDPTLDWDRVVGW